MRFSSLVEAQPSDARDLRAPDSGTLDVWMWDHGNGFAYSQLNAAEQARLERLVRPTARTQYLAAHAGLQQILAGYLGMPPGEVEWQIDDRGKPCCPDTDLQFNLSHSGEWNLLAVSGEEVGIDIERVRTVVSQQALAERYFSASEQQHLETLPEQEGQSLFFRLWTRKEACLKLMGTGLQGGLSELVALDVAAEGSLVALRETKHWPAGSCWLSDLPVADGYAAAVACAQPPQATRCYRLVTR
jgi:4'-phosphopantetheinyl transferase